MAFGRSWTADADVGRTSWSGGYSQFVEPTERSRSWLAPCAMSMVVVGMLGALAAISFVSSPPPAPQPATLSQLMEKHASSAALPYKHAVPYVTPVKHQLLRGACWLFSTVGVLEASYRKQGAEKGYLGAHEYLKLSEQAYGAVMARVCKENPACETGDADETWMGNTTEGGEAEWLYYLQKTVATTAAVPYSVCPYTQPPTPDTECAGAAAAAEKSPLEFTIPHAATLYDLPAIKRALHATDRPLAMALALFGQTYHFPCTKATAPYLQCDPDAAPPACAPCPLAPNFADVKCCVEQSRFGSNMRGEVTPNRPGEGLVASGGHAVVVVGYSDAYVSTANQHDRGALIIKNSWWDGVPPAGMSCHDTTAPCAAGRGSHTVDWYMGRVSDIDERDVCPNVHSPASWYRCADLKTCSAPATAMYAHAMRKVLRLECLAGASPYVHGVCNAGERFYLKSVTDWGGGLSKACLIRAAGGAELCLPPLWVEDLALLFAPVTEEAKENDPDLCGYYALPYATYELVTSTIGSTYATDLDIRWPDSAYARADRADRVDGKDYALLEANTVTQAQRRFSGPFPDLVDVLAPMKR